MNAEVYTINSDLQGSLPVTNAMVNGPIPVTATFSNNTGSDIITIKPDCFNTYFEVKDPDGNLLPSLCRIRTAYGPNDIFTLAANSSITISCNLAEMYDPSLLSNLTLGNYPVQATYSNYIQDNNLVGPNGESINWTGAIVATPAQINLSSTAPSSFTLTLHRRGRRNDSGDHVPDGQLWLKRFAGDGGTQHNSGYHFVNWSDGVLTASRTDTNVTANISVTANFAINTYTLTYTAHANGIISGTSPQTVSYGGNGTAVSAVPSTGYHFVNWSDGSTADPRKDTNVTANISVTASFAANANNYVLTVTKTGTGTGTVTASPGTLTWNGNVGSGNYSENIKVTLTATPNAGSTLSGWTAICKGSGNCSPTIDRNQMHRWHVRDLQCDSHF